MRRELTWLSYLRILLGVAGLSGALVLACTHCASVATPPPDVAAIRAGVLTRELAWLDDSTPLLHFATPEGYGAWRLRVERCSGLTREGWPNFYIAPVRPIWAGNEARWAYYDEDTQSIVFALGNEVNENTMEHETLHWLLRTHKSALHSGETPAELQARLHPPEYFEKKCGALLKA